MNVISTDKAPAAIGPYAQGVDLGSLVFFSGQVPLHPETGAIPQGIEAQTAQALENVKHLLAEAGLTPANVVKTTVFLSDMENFAAMNQLYGKFFTAPYPARSCVEVARLPKDVMVEIECIAAR